MAAPRASASESTGTESSSRPYFFRNGLPVPIPEEMNVWGWIGVGVGSFLVVSIAAGLAVAKILGAISSGINQILEHEGWASAPLTRARRDRRGSRTRG
jgi:hypothetical protein